MLELIPSGRLITLARDETNENKTILKELRQKIEDDHPQFAGFVGVGSCVLQSYCPQCL